MPKGELPGIESERRGNGSANSSGDNDWILFPLLPIIFTNCKNIVALLEVSAIQSNVKGGEVVHKVCGSRTLD